MIHRDVKPANILLAEDDFASLLDFGLANAATDAKLTSTGFTIGTFTYMSPERFSDGEVDHRSDIYALACVLYECLTGSPPYTRSDRYALIAAHGMDPIPRPSEHGLGISAAFDDVISRGMAKNAKDRYASAGELARAARRALIAPDQGRADVTAASTQAATVPTASPSKATPESRPSEKQDDEIPHQPTELASAQPAGAPKPAPTWQRPASSAKPSLIRAAIAVPLVLAVLFVGAAAFAVTQFLRPYPQPSTNPPQWQPYVDHAKKFTVDMTSLSYQDPDSGIQRVLDESTGQFHDDFASKSADFKQVVSQSKVVTQGTITGAGLESINGPTAEVLVTATSKITNNNGGTADEPRTWRLRVQVEKIGEAYKTSKVDFVP